MAGRKVMQYNIYKQTIHPLISIAAPFFFLAASGQVLAALTGSWLQISLYHYAVILGCGVLKVILNKIFNKEHIDKWNITREFAFTFALVYALFSIIKPGTFTGRFTPDEQNIYPLLLSVIQWLTTLRLHAFFYNRELFLDVVKQKTGEELQQLIRNTAELASDAYQDLKHFTGIFILQGITLFILLAAGIIINIQFQWPVIAWIGLYLVSVFLSVMAINLFKQEYADLGAGFNVCRQTQKRRFYISLFLVISCILLAALFAGNKALLKVPQIRLQFLPQAKPVITLPQSTFEPFVINREHLEAFQPSFPDLSWLFTWIGMVLGAFILIFIIIVLILPFFSPALFKWLKSKKILGFLIIKLSVFFQFLAGVVYDIILFFKSAFKKRTEKFIIDEIHNAAAGEKGKAFPFKKRAETNKVLKLFLKLIQWGNKHGIRYYYSQTVLEYTASVSAQFPLQTESLAYVAAVFEETLFSTHLVGAKALNRYKATIRQIIMQQ